MCIFSGKVDEVSKTNIFIRNLGHNFHALVYQMNVSTKYEVAMILPVPIENPQDNSIAFINLENYKDFFKDMDKLFPKPVSRGFGASSKTLSLQVHDVGDYIASFVPNKESFSRIDPIFQLNNTIWSKLPNYEGFGFAVFQLKPGRNKDIHPMAYSYKAANADELFIPTTHVHDGGHVPETADFDHTLYVQGVSNVSGFGWEISPLKTSDKIDISKVKGLVDPNMTIERCKLFGDYPNQDQILKTTEGKTKVTHNICRE